MRRLFIFIVFISTVVFFSQCDETPTPSDNKVNPITIKKTPSFNATQAYKHVQTQVNFGPRVSGSAAQQQCAKYISQHLEAVVDTVYIQKATVTQPISDKKYACINIIGSLNPHAAQRILLLCHWDSRPWADMDAVNKNKPIDAADDGASGVAVLLEIAAQIKSQPLNNIGVDFLFVDVEDVGRSEWTEESYCLGTQYWATHTHIPNYTAKFGICLDMVGAKNAQFPIEIFSKNYAGEFQKNIWDVANQLGYSSFFNYANAGPITDDHVVVNELAKIPCVDIINLQANSMFAPHWHTLQDNIAIIDSNTLKAVGQTVLQVIYNEDSN